VRFKVEVPGRGSSTPIVWGDSIFLLTAISTGDGGRNDQRLAPWQHDGSEVFEGESYRPAGEVLSFVVLALDRASGRERWRTEVARALPHEGIHPTNTWASASPSTDGRRLIAFFGSRGLFGLDLDGELLWSRDLGEMATRNGWGEGASPALIGDLVVIAWDHEGESFLAAFDADSGRQRWRVPRDEPSTWFTPVPAAVGDRRQVVTIGAHRVRGYDLGDGAVIWDGPGLGLNAIPTPLVHGGVAYLTAGYQEPVLLAVDLERAAGAIDEAGGVEDAGSGNEGAGGAGRGGEVEGGESAGGEVEGGPLEPVEGAGGALLWTYRRDTPYVASPLVVGDTLYLPKHLRGIVSLLDARTGERRLGPVRLPGIRNLYASPVAAGGRVYFAGREGVTVVVEHRDGADRLEVLATNTLDDGFDASPAIVGDELYLRGRRYLYRIDAPP
jgi:outer membrane protein assembly factor BamB